MRCLEESGDVGAFVENVSTLFCAVFFLEEWIMVAKGVETAFAIGEGNYERIVEGIISIIDFARYGGPRSSHSGQLQLLIDPT